MNTNLLVTQQQRPQPRRVAAPPEAPELQEVREDDVRDARGAQLPLRGVLVAFISGPRIRARFTALAIMPPGGRCFTLVSALSCLAPRDPVHGRLGPRVFPDTGWTPKLRGNETLSLSQNIEIMNSDTA